MGGAIIGGAAGGAVFGKKYAESIGSGSQQQLVSGDFLCLIPLVIVTALVIYFEITKKD